MRTTYTPAADVAAEIDRLRRQHGIGVSEAIDILARRGMSAQGKPKRRPRSRTFHMRGRIDVSNIGEVLDVLDSAQ
ncbi:MAG: hypothetical protein U0990_07895 [Candidatus Nanopelagicales bacterium]|nr:hypothetical protein [Candidatus Nanopelagicales bacterium]MDZ4249997.1 hypothetical protein [Candidatus Nanopelagicales bacterium]